MVDTEQHFENLQEVNELRLKNIELKKELEREQVLHKMLFKDWEKLTRQISTQKQEVYESSRPKNLFYKYAFYVLLIGLVPAFYFLYPQTDNKKSFSLPVVSDTMRPENIAQTRAAAPVTNSVSGRDSVSTVQKKQISNQEVTQQPAPPQPVLQPEEKKANTHDSTKPRRLIIRNQVVEMPLTDDARDSISSLGFSAYFDHHRNPFRRSSEKYKAWAQGRNEGKAEAKKLVEKNTCL